MRTVLVKDPAQRPSAAALLQHKWVVGHARRAELARQRSQPGPARVAAAVPAPWLPRTASSPIPMLAKLAAPAQRVACRLAGKPLPHGGGGSATSVLDPVSSGSTAATAGADLCSLPSAGSEQSFAAVPEAPPAAAPAGRSASGDDEMPPAESFLPEQTPSPKGAAELLAGAPQVPLLCVSPGTALPAPFTQQLQLAGSPLPPAPPRGMQAALEAEAARVAAQYRPAAQAAQAGQAAQAAAAAAPAAPQEDELSKPPSARSRVAAYLKAAPGAIRRQTARTLNKVAWPRSRGGSQAGGRPRSSSVRSAASAEDRSRGSSFCSVASSAPSRRSRGSSLLSALPPGIGGSGSRSNSVFSAAGAEGRASGPPEETQQPRGSTVRDVWSK